MIDSDCEDYILNNGYKTILRKKILSVFENLEDKRYTLILFYANLYLFFEEECLATSNDCLDLYEYNNIPKDVLLELSCGKSSEIREKLYAYDLNRTLEVLG